MVTIVHCPTLVKTRMRNVPEMFVLVWKDSFCYQETTLVCHVCIAFFSQLILINSLPNEKILNLSKLNAFADNNLNVYQKL